MVMKTKRLIEMDAKQVTKDFLNGSLPIVEYRRLFDDGQELEAFLQKIVDDIKASGGKIEPYPFTMDDGSVSLYNEGIDRLLAPEIDPGLEYGLPPRYESVRQMLAYECRNDHQQCSNCRRCKPFF